MSLLHTRSCQKEYKLNSKTWINKNILAHMKKRDKLLCRYCKANENDSLYAQAICEEYKVIRNSITKMKRESKIDYTIENILKQIKIKFHPPRKELGQL